MELIRALKINHILSRINPIPHIDTYFLRSILILSSHPRLLPKDLFLVGVLVKILKALFTLFHSGYVTYSS